MTPDDEFYSPDPDAPWYHKINPCHCDHVDALNWVQSFMECFAPHCQCCSGTRVFVLLVAALLAISTGTIFKVAALLLVFVVVLAIAYDLYVRAKERRMIQAYYDNSDEG